MSLTAVSTKTPVTYFNNEVNSETSAIGLCSKHSMAIHTNTFLDSGSEEDREPAHADSDDSQETSRAGREQRLARDRDLAKARRERKENRDDYIRTRINFLRESNDMLKLQNSELLREISILRESTDSSPPAQNAITTPLLPIQEVGGGSHLLSSTRKEDSNAQSSSAVEASHSSNQSSHQLSAHKQNQIDDPVLSSRSSCNSVKNVSDLKGSSMIGELLNRCFSISLLDL